MNTDFSLRVAYGQTETDVTDYVRSITWSGGYNQRARTLDADVLWDREVPLGADASFYTGGELRFFGKVQERYLDTKSPVRELNCVDLGFYLKNKVSRRYKGVTPETVVAQLLGEFGIEAGAIAKTGRTFSRQFAGVELYKIIQTAYTLAPRDEKTRYVTRFRGRKLEVAEKVPGPTTPILRPGSNLISMTNRESIASTVTQVEIRDKNGRVVDTVRDENLVKLYGVIQDSVAQGSDRDARTEARKILADNPVGQRIIVECTGTLGVISGDCVVLQEPVSGAYGLFWVDGDAYTWNKDGTRRCKLTLNFRNLMDEAEAGSLLKG